MAAFDFPSSPSLGQLYPTPAVAGQVQYLWDGEKWTTTAGLASSSAFVKIAGDIMTGALELPAAAPTLGTHAANKAYADTKVAKAGDTMTGGLIASYGIFNGTGSTTAIGTFGATGNCLELLIDGSSNAMLQSFNRTSGTWRPFKITSGALTLDSGGTATTIIGSMLNVVGPIFSSQSATQGTIQFSNTGTRYIYYDGATFNFTGGKIGVDVGYQFRKGAGGVTNGQTFNFFWSTVPTMEIYVDNVYLGNMSYTSDYRTKKDVVDLPTMWDTVKALRPIKYTQAEFRPPAHAAYIAKQLAKAKAEPEPDPGIDPDPEAKPRDQINTGPMFAADDIERWGFIAHELQETLTQTAASSVKDAPDAVQSPNPFTLIAALTKALQEAMARIEALEASG